MSSKITHIIILLYISLHCESQKSISLDEMFENNRTVDLVYKDINFAIDNYDSQQILDISNKYLSSENENDRRLSYRFLNGLIEDNNNNSILLNAVYYLIDKGLTDKSSMLVSSVLNYLEEIPNELFDNRSRNRFAAIIIDDPNHYKRIVMLSGRLEMQELITYYENRLKHDSTINKRDIWALQLTLARMGDPLMVNRCISQIETLGINDQVVYNLIPDLIYIEDKLVTDYLLDELAVQNLNCTSADPDNEVAIDCGYRLVEYLAPFIQDFPVGVGASGDLDCDNYEQTLKEVRVWISDNRNNYKTMFEE